jgi:hypothetical protein
MALMISRQEGRRIDPDRIGYSVAYNRKFVLTAVGDLLEQARTLLSIPAPAKIPELSRLFLQRVLDAVLRRDHPSYEKVRKAIESAEMHAETETGQEVRS